MKKRIGNDISFVWHIYRKSGDSQVPESFTGKDVEVKLISPLQRPVTIEDVSIATGVVTFTFRGKHQVTLGNYVAVLLENKGEDGMVTLDVVNAVTLVPHSYMEEDGDEGDVIEATSVELDSEIGQGIDAYTKAESDELFLRKRVAQGGQYTERGLVTSMVNTIDGVGTLSTNAYAGGIIIGNNTNMLTLSPNEIVKSVAYGSPVSVVWADTLAEALAGKQDTINDLAAIRSGAQAGATAYQKPATGIPATDLASAVQVSLGKANTALQEHQSLAGLVNTGNYNTVSKKIELKHDNTVLAEIDATAFIKDGMVSSVTISNGYLVITFNTDAGKEPISIALTDIFNPANYYTKTQVDNALSNKLDASGSNYGVYNGVLKISGLQDQDGIEYIRNGMHLPQGLEIYYYNYKTTITGEDIVVHSKGEPEDGSVSLRALAREVDGKANSADLAEVATSGSYNDLTDKPTIPAAQVQSDWNESDTASKAYIKNKPTIPTVPTNVSAFNNDAGYITEDDMDDVPTPNSNNLVKSGGVYEFTKKLIKDETVNIPIIFTTGYYYSVSANRVSKIAGTGKCSDYIDLTDYVGYKLVVKCIGANASSSRATGIVNNDISTLYRSESLFLESNFIKDSIEEGDMLFISSTNSAVFTVEIQNYDGEIYRVLKYTEENIELLNKRVGEYEEEHNITPESLERGYYFISNGSFALSSSTSGRYVEKIDLSDYVGFFLNLTFPSSSTSSKYSGIGDVNGIVKYSTISGIGVTWKIAEGDFLYASSAAGNFPNITILDYATGLTKKVFDLNKVVYDANLEHPKKYKDLALTPRPEDVDYITISESYFESCSFTNSLSKKISGRGSLHNLYINLQDSNIDDYRCGSFGIYFPWEMQRKIRLNFYVDSDKVAATIFAATKGGSGEVFYMQGKTFQRINFPHFSDRLTIRVELAEGLGSDEEWEFLISSKAVLNDEMPIAPICVMYDGGGWAGTVIDDGESMSLWQLHHKYNIPYGIARDIETLENINPEVLADITSGFAEYVYRPADVIPYYGQNDKIIIDKLIETENSIPTDCKFIALPQHKLDQQMYRCYTKFGANVVRTGACNSPFGNFSSKPTDGILFTLPSFRLGGSLSTVTADNLIKLPNILWEHGVGIPPEGDDGNSYVDQTGLNTPLAFRKLHQFMEDGIITCLRPSDFIALCYSEA